MEPTKLYRTIGEEKWNKAINIIKNNSSINDLIVCINYNNNNYAWVYALITWNNSLRKIILKISINHLKENNKTNNDLIEYIKLKL